MISIRNKVPGIIFKRNYPIRKQDSTPYVEVLCLIVDMVNGVINDVDEELFLYKQYRCTICKTI